MKTLFIFIGTFIFLLLQDVGNVRAATLKCPDIKPIIDLTDHKADVANNTEEFNLNNNSREENKNSLNKIFQNIQCTLEKAKPWMAELQQEAKRLEEAAKLLGLGILHSFGEFVDKLVEETSEANPKIQNTTTAKTEEEDLASTTEMVKEEISQYLCPEGFAADQNGICVNESIE